MALTRSRIQKRSDDRRDMVQKNLKLPKETARRLAYYAHQTDKTQAAIITEALALWADKHGIAVPE